MTRLLGALVLQLTSANTKRQLLVLFGVYAFALGSFNHVQTSSGVQVQGHPGEQLPWGYCEVTFAHSSMRLENPSTVALPCPAWSAHQRTAPAEQPV
jgi:hypothetical protein